MANDAKPEFDVTYKEFQEIISYAKSEWVRLTFPLKIDNKEIDIKEQANYCMFVAVVAFLNKKDILKKVPILNKGR